MIASAAEKHATAIRMVVSMMETMKVAGADPCQHVLVKVCEAAEKHAFVRKTTKEHALVHVGL